MANQLTLFCTMRVIRSGMESTSVAAVRSVLVAQNEVLLSAVSRREVAGFNHGDWSHTSRGLLIMKKLVCALLTAISIVPAVSFAQTSNGPATRAEARAELVQLERAGYQPAAKRIHYLDGMQAAEQRAQGSDNAYASQSGAHGSSALASATASPHVDAAN
jgi:hypothetical protein